MKNIKAELMYIICGNIWVATYVITNRWYCLILGIIYLIIGVILEQTNKK